MTLLSASLVNRFAISFTSFLSISIYTTATLIFDQFPEICYNNLTRRTRTRAGIIIYNPNIQSLLLIHRIKDNRDYYVIPGGGQNSGEAALQTAQREIAEELGWNIPQQDLTAAFTIQDQDRQESYFLYQTAKTATPSIQGKEKERSIANNRYLPCWVPLKQIQNINLQPSSLLPPLLQLLQAKTTWNQAVFFFNPLKSLRFGMVWAEHSSPLLIPRS